MFIQQLNKYAVVILSSQFPGPHIFTLPWRELSGDRKTSEVAGWRNAQDTNEIFKLGQDA